MANRKSEKTTKVKIYEAIIAAAERYSLPAPWSRFQSHGAFHRLPEDLDPLLTQLIKQFDKPSLIAAGILVKDAGDAPIANPWLEKFRDCLLAMVRPAPSIAMIAGPHAIDGSSAVITLLQSPVMEPLIRRAANRIFITFSAADSAVLWSMGLPAVPGERLVDLGGEELEEFCELLRLSRVKAAQPKPVFGASKSSPVRSPIFPIFVDWSPAALSLVADPEVRRAETHFSKIAQYFGTDLRGGGTWKPTEAQIEELKFAIQYGKLEHVLDALLKSSETNREPFSGPGGDSFAVSNSLATAIEQWQAACDQNDVRKQQEAWSALRRAHAEELMNPIVKMSQATNDSLMKNELFVLAQTSDVFHQRAAVSGARLSKAVGNQGLQSISDIPVHEFRALDSLARGVLAQTKEIRSCCKKGRKLGRPLKQKAR